MHDVECVLCVIYMVLAPVETRLYCMNDGKAPFGGSRRSDHGAARSYAWTGREPSIQLGRAACRTFHFPGPG